MKAINECDQNRIDAASGNFPVILAPVGLIGSPAAIRAYLAHEAKKAPCAVCGVCTPEKTQG